MILYFSTRKCGFSVPLLAKLIALVGYLWIIYINIALMETISNDCQRQIPKSGSSYSIINICREKIPMCFTIILSIIKIIFIVILLAFRFNNVCKKYNRIINLDPVQI
jgi:hypothetical protein